MLGALGKMDPKKMQKLMKRFNMDVEEVPAEEVIIKTKNKDIIIKEPEVMIVDMMGRDVYQISGNAVESITGPSEDDIETVMEQTGKERELVVSTLEEVNHDLAEAIIRLNEEKEKKE